MAFVEAVTYYHQYQRNEKVNKHTGELYIETTLEDIGIANELIKDILLRKSDELTGACRKYFEKLKNFLKKNCTDTFKTKDIRSEFRISSSSLNRYQQQLLNSDFIRIISGNKQKGFEYGVTDFEEYHLLQSHVHSALDQALQQLSG